MSQPTFTQPFLTNIIKYKGTCLLILANVLAFSFQAADHTVISLLSEGANFAPYSLGHQPYRLLTSIFLHGNLFHLLVNMYNLFLLGRIIENQIGLLKFLNLFLLAGIVGSLLSCWLNLFVISVGASGALFGLYSYQFLEEWKRSKSEKKSLLINFIIFLVLNISFGRFINVDQYAHLGGFLAGIVVNLVTNLKSIPHVSLFVWIFPIGIFTIIPRTQLAYYDAYQYMLSKDDHIRSALNSDYLNQEEQAEKINVIKNLPDSIKIKFSKIENLPVELQLDTAAIYTFFNFRIRQIDYFLKLLENDSYLYQDSILIINTKLLEAARPTYALGYGESHQDNTVININRAGLQQEREYYDENWDPTPYVHKAKYYRIGTKDSLGHWHGKIVDYFADDTPQMKGTYNRDLKQGIFIYYNEDGTISGAGCYNHDQKVGKWEYYYSNNRLESEIRYIDNFSYIENIYDSVGNQLVKEGKGIDIEYHTNGSLASKRTIEGGLNHGVFEGYYEDGQPYFIEYHKKGFLDYGISYDTLGNVYRYDEQTEWPYPHGGFEKLIEYFEANNKMKSLDFEGFVELKFRVRTDGSIHEIVVTKSLGPELDQHAKDLLLEGPNWHAAKFRGFETVERTSFVRVMF